MQRPLGRARNSTRPMPRALPPSRIHTSLAVRFASFTAAASSRSVTVAIVYPLSVVHAVDAARDRYVTVSSWLRLDRFGQLRIKDKARSLIQIRTCLALGFDRTALDRHL